MASVNEVTLIGNAGRDPEVRNLQSGDKTVSFSLATTDSWTDKSSGERKSRTEWHRVVIFNPNLAEIADKYVRKGSLLHVRGAIQSRKYTDKDGQERTVTEVVLDRMHARLTLLGDPKDGAGEQRGENRPDARSEGRTEPRAGPDGRHRPNERSATPARGGGSWDGGMPEDDIPF